MRHWKVYLCSRCAGAVCAEAGYEEGSVDNYFPDTPGVEPDIPAPASDYLRQALDSVHAPAGCVMLAASAIDAMLKAKGYKKGWLNDRINQARDAHLITPEMAQWAHDVRLDANDPRHADEVNPLPSEEDARRVVDFALALGQFLFVLPARVQRGLHPEATR